jgi:addiction module HigA family antidote
MATKSKSSITTRELQNKHRLPPVTPGEILAEEFMKPLRLSSNALALALHVPATRIQAIVNGKRAITAETALRLSRYFGNSAEFWLNLEQHYELDVARREKLERIEAEITIRFSVATSTSRPAQAKAPKPRRNAARSYSRRVGECAG